jgi:hypothetical protein
VTGRPAVVRPAEVSQILTWCARLTAAGSRASAAEVAAYLTAKASLLERIAADRHTEGWTSRGIQAAREAAAGARTAAALAAAGITTLED